MKEEQKKPGVWRRHHAERSRECGDTAWVRKRRVGAVGR